MADENNQITSVLDLSDEEIMKLDPATLSTATPVAGAEEVDAGQGEAEDNQNPDEQQAADLGDDNDDQGTPAAPTTEPATEVDPTAEPADKVDAPAKDVKQPKPADAGKPAAPAKADPVADAVPVVDAKAFQDKILAPFKANGRDMQVRDADEAIALMQKGAGFHKRMEQLKPNLAIVESLRKADLLDQSKIDFLIDVMAKKPEAISKLVKDSGIDPLDLTADKADGYKPTSYKVSDAEQELDAVWNELESSEHFARTVTVVAQEWDKASQDLIAKQPAVLRVINAHMENGIYDRVAAEIDREKALGRLTGLSDLEAYRQVGDAMLAAGVFKQVDPKAGQPEVKGQGTPAVPAVVPQKPKQADDSDRNDKKRGAAPARATPGSAQAAIKNPLAMSDEEIMKLL